SRPARYLPGALATLNSVEDGAQARLKRQCRRLLARARLAIRPLARPEHLIEDVLRAADGGSALPEQTIGTVRNAGGDRARYGADRTAELLCELDRDERSGGIGRLDHDGDLAE